jgi:hypothetical protein
MAEGEFIKPIVDLLAELEEKLGGPYKADEAVLNELIRWLSVDDIRKFVRDYRRNHELPPDEDLVRIEHTPWEGDTIYK